MTAGDLPRSVGLRRAIAAAACSLAALGAGAASPPHAAAAPAASPTPAFAPDLPGAGEPAQRATSARGGTSKISRPRLKKKLRKLSRGLGSSSGIYVWDTGAGAGRRELFGVREGRARKLASNQKLFTTAAALDRLGADGQIKTSVYRRGQVNLRGTLKGDLVLVGGGDPTLGSKSYGAAHGYLATPLTPLASAVKQAGITKVRGSILADETVFDRRRGVPDSGWGVSEWIDPLGGLTYNHSTNGSEPSLAAAAALRDRLKSKGIRVKAGIAKGRAGKKVRARGPLAQVMSPTITRIVRQTNKFSDNFYAEMLLKRIWARDDRRGTTPGGARAVERFARRSGSKVRALDGSGLTDNNRSSPRNVVRLLTTMARHEATHEFSDSLAIAGRDGTLAKRMRGTAAEGRCRGKTGTISGVSALSGYCDAGRGRIVFSILMNGVGYTEGARDLQDRLVAQMARYRP